MRTEAIANAIEKDLLADRPQSQHQSQLCFACGRSYCHGDSRFCSPRCRNAFDAGAPPHGESEPRRSTYTWLNGRPMKARGDGFAIECKACGHEVISKGHRVLLGRMRASVPRARKDRRNDGRSRDGAHPSAQVRGMRRGDPTLPRHWQGTARDQEGCTLLLQALR